MSNENISALAWHSPLLSSRPINSPVSLGIRPSNRDFPFPIPPDHHHHHRISHHPLSTYSNHITSRFTSRFHRCASGPLHTIVPIPSPMLPPTPMGTRIPPLHCFLYSKTVPLIVPISLVKNIPHLTFAAFAFAFAFAFASAFASASAFVLVLVLAAAVKVPSVPHPSSPILLASRAFLV